MDRLFQDWLVTTISQLCAPLGIRVDDDVPIVLARHGQEHLSFRPDLVLRRAGRPLAVLDAKHITLDSYPKAAHVQQVMAYAQVLGLDEAWLIYPSRPGREDAVRRWTVTRPESDDFCIGMAPIALWAVLKRAHEDISRTVSIFHHG